MLHLHQLGLHLRLVQRSQVGVFVGADVFHAAHHAQCPALGIAQDKAPVEHPDAAAIVAQHAVLGLPGVVVVVVVGGGRAGLVLGGCAQRLHHALAVSRVYALGPGLVVGHGLVGSQGQQSPERAAPPDVAAAHVPVPHRIGGGVSHQVKALFAQAQRLVLAAQLQLRHGLAGQALQGVALDGVQGAWLGVHHHQRAQGKTVGRDQRRAGIKTDVRRPQHQRVVFEERVLARIGHLDHLAPAIEPVRAKGHGAVGLGHGHAHCRLEPLAPGIDEVDQRHRHGAHLRSQTGQLVKGLFGRGVHDGVRLQHSQALGFGVTGLHGCGHGPALCHSGQALIR